MVDYTVNMIENPDKFSVAYMIPPGTRKQAIAKVVAKLAFWLVPSYIWLLRKPGVFVTQQDAAADRQPATRAVGGWACCYIRMDVHELVALNIYLHGLPVAIFVVLLIYLFRLISRKKLSRARALGGRVTHR